jgi:hypothetical protein
MAEWLGVTPGSTTTLREWTALSIAMRDAAARAGTNEIVVLDDGPAARLARWPDSLLGGRLEARSLPGSMVLPLERETVYVLSGGDGATSETRLPAELQRPSSMLHVLTAAEVDAGARILTLRPRPAADWLARVRAVANGRFEDGSAIVGVAIEPTVMGRVQVTLYWELATLASRRLPGDRLRIATRSTSRPASSDERLPAVAVRRDGELTLVQVVLTGVARTGSDEALLVTLLDASGRPIRAAAGGETVEVPLRSGEP